MPARDECLQQALTFKLLFDKASGKSERKMLASLAQSWRRLAFKPSASELNLSKVGRPTRSRTRASRVEFGRPFRLKDLESLQPARIYTVETYSELDTLSGMATYRRLSTNNRATLRDLNNEVGGYRSGRP